MKRTLLAVAIAVAAAASLAPTAGASTQKVHACRGGDPPITASAHTSCSFAGSIVNAYANTRMPRTWHGQVRSPVTHHRYAITCRRFGDWSTGYVSCFTASFSAWINFSADI